MSVLAAGGVGPGQAGPLGLLIVVLLGLATWLLLRSLNTHLKRVPRSFEDDRSPDDGGEDQTRRR